MFESIRGLYFPAELGSGVRATSVEGPIFWQMLGTIAEQDRPCSSLADLGSYVTPPERTPRSRPLAATYAQPHHEYIVFMDQNQQCVGWSSGAMLDSQTFFMAYSAVIPRYQRHGLYSAFLRALLPYLHALGYERVTSNHMVNNRAVLIAKLKASFIVTGTLLDERWGAQVSLAYLLFYEDRRAGFARAYSLETYAGTPEYFSQQDAPV